MGEQWYSKHVLPLFLVAAVVVALGVAPAIALLIFVPLDKLFPVYGPDALGSIFSNRASDWYLNS
jgi:Ni/Fe-hydrogenase subunit HybB-like protein